MLVFQPRHIMKRMFPNSCSTPLPDPCGAVPFQQETHSSPSSLWRHNKTNKATLQTHLLLFKRGGISPLFSLDELIELWAACASVELYQGRPAVPLHLANVTEPQASSWPAREGELREDRVLHGERFCDALFQGMLQKLFFRTRQKLSSRLSICSS